MFFQAPSGLIVRSSNHTGLLSGFSHLYNALTYVLSGTILGTALVGLNQFIMQWDYLIFLLPLRKLLCQEGLLLHLMDSEHPVPQQQNNQCFDSIKRFTPMCSLFYFDYLDTSLCTPEAW